MSFKPVAAFVALSVSSFGVASADVSSQITSLQSQINQLQSQVSAMGKASVPSSPSGLIGLDSSLSATMMNNQSGVSKDLTLLQARQNGLNQMLTLGGYIQADAVYDHSSPAGNFINPAINDHASSTASNASRLMVSDVSLSTIANLGSWMTGYIQVGKTNVGEDTASSLVGVQQAYMVFGNLSQMPVYGFVGQKDIDFGSFATVDMYNAPLTRTLFQAYGNTAGIGYFADGFNAVASFMNGGAESQRAVAVTSNYRYANLNTTSASNINNYALNFSYGMTNDGITWNLGAGYLAGSSYLTTAQKTNGAWDMNAKVSMNGFDVMGEYVTTAQNAYGANGRVKAWDIGADYNFLSMGLSSVVSIDYSGAQMGEVAGGKGSQYVLGYRIQPLANVWTGIEYAYTKGGMNFMGTAGNTGSIPASVNTTVTGSAVDNVKNQTIALDISAAF